MPLKSLAEGINLFNELVTMEIKRSPDDLPELSFNGTRADPPAWAMMKFASSAFGGSAREKDLVPRMSSTVSHDSRF